MQRLDCIKVISAADPCLPFSAAIRGGGPRAAWWRGLAPAYITVIDTFKHGAQARRQGSRGNRCTPAAFRSQSRAPAHFCKAKDAL